MTEKSLKTSELSEINQNEFQIEAKLVAKRTGGNSTYVFHNEENGNKTTVTGTPLLDVAVGAEGTLTYKFVKEENGFTGNILVDFIPRV